MEEIDLRIHNRAALQGDDGPAHNSEESDKLLVEETEGFKAKYLLQGKLLQAELLKRLGSKYAEALDHESSRRAAIEASQLMLADGALVGADPLSNLASYLEDLANDLP